MHDKLEKVRALINFLTERFSLVCSPDKHVSVDEAMIPFKEGLSSSSTCLKSLFGVVSKSG